MGAITGYEIQPARWLHAELPCGGYSVGVHPPLSEEQERTIRGAEGLGSLLGNSILHSDNQKPYTEIKIETKDLKPEQGEDCRDAYGRLFCQKADERTLQAAHLIGKALEADVPLVYVSEVIRAVGNGEDHFYKPQPVAEPLETVAA